MAKKKDAGELPALEPLLARVEALGHSATWFTLVIPWRVTMNGRRVDSMFAEALLTDRLLTKGLVATRKSEERGEKRIQFRRQPTPRRTKPRTEPPPLDVTGRVPALTPLAKTCIRLHPQRARVPKRAASKIGGTFLWPSSETWPRCDDPLHKTGVRGRPSATGGINPLLVGVIQLNADDFPDVPFRPGCDLLQLLWCPTAEEAHDDAYMFPKAFHYWRTSADITNPLPAHPLPDVVEGLNNYYPVCCRFFPEPINELPTPAGFYDLPSGKEIHSALTANEDLWHQYQNDFSACPATKLGGHPYWVQNDDTPTCECGTRMEFLLQLVDWEYTNTDDTQRWIPTKDRWAVDAPKTDPAVVAILRPPLFDFGHHVYYFFVCRNCPAWPVRMVDQR